VQVTVRDLELLQGLYELRYLEAGQIGKRWFGGVPAETTRWRLWMLVKEQLLERQVVQAALDEVALSVYRVTPRGMQVLKSRGLPVGNYYESVRVQFLRHLIETNAVFLALAGSTPWSDLSFQWQGSHRARFEYAEPGSVVSGHAERRRVLCPDAVITPKDPAAPRTLLELDRATETISAKRGRNSIVGKLRAYRTFLRRVIPGEERTAYDVAFRRDPKAARVVFALASPDPTRERERSILSAANAEAPELDVRCVRLADAERLRALILPSCSSSAPVAQAMPARTGRAVEITDTGIYELRESYVESADVLRAAAQRDPVSGERLRRLAHAVRAVLKRAKEQLEGPQADVG
jgi:hypothetical protein